MKDVRIYGFADESDKFIDGQIKAVKRNGLEGIEVRTVDEQSVSEITLDKAREVKKKFDDNGIKVYAIGSPLGKIKIETDDFNAHLETVKHVIDIANIFGAENIRMFSFYMPKDKDIALFRNEVIDRLNTMCALAKNKNVVLCHENEKGIYGDSAERCLDILKNVDGIGGIFDPANFVQCGVDTLKAWDILKENIKYMHIKDAREDGNVVPAGKGAGNVKAIVADYIARGGKYFTMEPHLSVFDALKNLEQAGEEIQVGNTYKFDTKENAFDFACTTFKKLVEEI